MHGQMDPPVNYICTLGLDARIILCRACLGMVTIGEALVACDVGYQENH